MIDPKDASTVNIKTCVWQRKWHKSLGSIFRFELSQFFEALKYFWILWWFNNYHTVLNSVETSIFSCTSKMDLSPNSGKCVNWLLIMNNNASKSPFIYWYSSYWFTEMCQYLSSYWYRNEVRRLPMSVTHDI